MRKFVEAGLKLCAGIVELLGRLHRTVTRKYKVQPRRCLENCVHESQHQPQQLRTFEWSVMWDPNKFGEPLNG